MKIKSFLLPVLLLAGLISCIEDTVQLENISTEVQIERSIAIPLVNASFRYTDIAGEGYDSYDLTAAGDTIYFYLIETVTFEDTLEFGEVGLNMDFEFIQIFHKITNMFPLNLDMQLYLYNELTRETIDTINFKTPGDRYFIKAPTVLAANGLIDESAVETKKGVIDLDRSTLDNLFNNTTHLIIYAAVAETDTIVKMLGRHKIELGLGLSAKGQYITDLDSLSNPNTSIQ